MLYLNYYEAGKRVPAPDDLTLTSVVFEYKLEIFFWSWKRYLTLTSVVFEFTIALHKI